ncbi:Nuc-1 negative regulatory protein preg [Cytospora mali]|uniref:Nuc-1 negative regulatory protein preg n=1 Tax=Cytospora mali TaxID=578113 RepID=A0A194V4E4_CYTMA|nr:Nuc-1 negative regulatory protein preg [Valsa mali var. pyri (nom. inval.)]
MLTRSPVPARSPSASPSSFHTSFHYAPVSPQHRSPKVPTAVSRRPSTTSPLGTAMTSPSHSSKQQSQPSPKPALQPEGTTKYVGIDAATQYSPMEPHNYFAPRKAPTEPSPLSTTQSVPGAVPPQTPNQPATTKSESRANITIPTSEATTAGDSQATAATTTAPLESEPPMLKAPHPLSPNKRRNSEGPGASVGDSSTTGQAAGALPKRVKPDVAPPKVLPVRYEFCAIEDVVVLIANMLAELIETNDALAMRSGHLTRFHSRTAPGISVLDYLHRLAKHATLTPPLLLSMVYYIDRLCALYPDFTINTLTVHRFLITAATVAAKGLSDSFWNNSTYARVGGVRVAELKLLELDFLTRVDWKIVPDPDVLVAYYRGLVQRSPAYALEDEVELENGIDEEEEISDEVDEDDDEAEDASENEISPHEKPPGSPAQT